MVLTGFIFATAAPKPSDQHSAELACFIYHREEDSFNLLLDSFHWTFLFQTFIQLIYEIKPPCFHYIFGQLLDPPKP